MKCKSAIFILIAFLAPVFHYAQTEKYTLSGYIEDGTSGEKLMAANLLENKSLHGTTSNNYGFFSLTLDKDSVSLTASYIGYSNAAFQFYLSKDTFLIIKLSPNLELTIIEVTSAKTERIEENTQMGRIEVPLDQIEKLPALLGEVDVLKTLQLLPGVQGGGEGQNGLYVRGGSPDQNLILLDGVPVYNVSHLLGFFSVFNSDAIRNVTLTKGGYPSRYGGRLSSVIEIYMKEGDMNKFHGEGSIGLIASRLTLEGPLDKGKTSFMVSGRRTYADFMFKPILNASTEPENEAKLRMYFYDLNFKVNHKLNDQHRLFLSAYSGLDIFGAKYKDNFPGGYYLTSGEVDWGNITAAGRWNWMISKKLFSNTTFTYSRFRFNFLAEVEEKDSTEFSSYSANYHSGIFDWAGKVDFDFIPNPTHYIRFGAGVTHHTYDPGAFVFKARFNSENFDTILGSTRTKAFEYALYGEDDINLGALKMNLGLHASGFFVDNVFYPSVQPRLGLRLLISNSWAVKAAFSTMTQYINLLTNESLSLPTDLWVPSTKRVKPQRSWQPSVGVASTISNDFEFSLETYYKKMSNVISYKEGISFLGLENDWQDKVIQGKGESYGAELFIQKKRGKTTGWIGYTLSWTWRQYDEINSGRRYPFKYDRRHDFEIVMTHRLAERITFSMAWLYGTGNAITLPLARYGSPIYYNGTIGEYYVKELQSISEKNSFRMRAYHRLDASLEFHKKLKRHERTWVLSVYNAYNRANPYYIFDGRDEEGKRAFRQVSLFPVIPSLSYNFKF